MIDTASVVVSQPLPVVEAMVRDVSSWVSLFGEVEEVSRLARDRYLVQLRRGRRTCSALLRVHRKSAEHRFGWHTISGPAWSGELHLVALTGRRTAVHLTFDRTARTARTARTTRTARTARTARTGRNSQGLHAALRQSMRRLIPGRAAGARLPGFGQAKRDLNRFRERVDALPRPVRPQRLGPLPGARPIEDVLIVDGMRHRGDPRGRTGDGVPTSTGDSGNA